MTPLLNEQEIQELVTSPKRITHRDPASGYREENGQRRWDLDLESVADQTVKFGVFIRQNSRYIENFSIGLRYHSNDRQLGTITLARYNGPHGEVSRQPDGHFAKSHIHRITAAELAAGYLQPRERHREITERYSTLESALAIFLEDVGITNGEAHFFDSLQGRFFDEPS